MPSFCQWSPGYQGYDPGWYYGDYASPVYSPGYYTASAVLDTYTNSSSYRSAATVPHTYPQPEDNAVYVRVQVPADAEVWFEGQKTAQKGPVRFFESPSLTPGREYVYHIRARWNENGHEVDQTREATVYAGGKFSIDFTKMKNETPPKASPTG